MWASPGGRGGGGDPERQLQQYDPDDIWIRHETCHVWQEYSAVRLETRCHCCRIDGPASPTLVHQCGNAGTLFSVGSWIGNFSLSICRSSNCSCFQSSLVWKSFFTCEWETEGSHHGDSEGPYGVRMSGRRNASSFIRRANGSICYLIPINYRPICYSVFYLQNFYRKASSNVVLQQSTAISQAVEWLVRLCEERAARGTARN